jgi:uncharacterized phage protein (TIGR02216 family)
MAVGLGVMRIEPKAFWAMTLVEFSAVVGVFLAGPGAPTRSVLRELMQRFPD